MKEKDDISLFEPSKRDLRLDHPELGEISEFRDLTSHQLKFVWYYANPTSPLSRIKGDRTRIEAALNKAFPSGAPEAVTSSYLEKNFPDKISRAIERMKRFRPAIRSKARDTIQRIFDNFVKISDASKEDLQIDGKAKQYVDLAVKIAGTMPELVEQLERGFGVKDGASDIEKSTGARIADLLSSMEEDG